MFQSPLALYIITRWVSVKFVQVLTITDKVKTTQRANAGFTIMLSNRENSNYYICKITIYCSQLECIHVLRKLYSDRFVKIDCINFIVYSLKIFIKQE